MPSEGFAIFDFAGIVELVRQVHLLSSWKTSPVYGWNGKVKSYEKRPAVQQIAELSHSNLAPEESIIASESDLYQDLKSAF